ncbi:MAG: transposase [Phycisphaerales bacterium]
MKRWCEQSGTGTLYIDPGAPWQDGIVESFNGRLRDELPSSELFETLAATRYLADRRRLHYNHRRPQRALGKRTPAAFAAACPAPPPLRLVALACAAASPDTQGAGAMNTLSQGVDR